MKLNRGLAMAVAFVALGLRVHVADARGPSTAEERAKVIELTRSLEKEPLAESARGTRQWLLEWTTEVPDISVKVCADLLGPALDDKYPYSGEVNLQMIFSAAAFVIEHPEKAKDDIAMYTAGAEGALRVYEVLVKSKPEAKLVFLDDLVAKRERGELPDHVAKVAKKKCK